MIVDTPDGQAEFPDSMSPADIQNVLRQKYGFKGGAQGAPAQTPSPPQTSTSAPISPSSPGGVGQASDGQDLGSTAFWNKPADASWSDYLLAHLAKQTQGAGQASEDYGRAIADTTTFGQSDRLLAAINGTSLADERNQTAAAHQRLGAGDYIANAAGYLPLGELGIAGRLGGGLLGMMGEGAALGAAGALGHDQSVTRGAIAGGIGGGVGGVASKVLINPIAGGIANKLGMGPDINAAAGKITSQFEQNTADAYQALKTVPYSDVGQAAANARAEIEAAYPGGPKGSTMQQAAPRTMGVLANIDRATAPSSSPALNGQDAANYLLSQRGTMSPDDYTAAWAQLAKTGEIASPGQQTTLTGHDILTWLDKLRDIQGPLAGPENDLAPIVEKHLNNVLANSAPTNGMPVGTGAQMLTAAKEANKLSQSASGLQTAARKLRDYGTSPASWAEDQSKFYPDPNSPQYQALSKIANSGGAPGGQGGYTITHGFVHPVVEGLALATLPAGIAPAAAAALTFMGIKPMINAGMGAGTKAAQLSQLYKSYPAMTGQQFTPPTGPDAGAALRALILGHAAANQKPF